MTTEATAIENPSTVLREFGACEPAGEAALLITCLRGLPCLVPQDTDWNLLLALARENGVLPLLYQSLLAIGAQLPACFHDAAVKSRAHAEQLASELASLLQDFRELGVEVIPLKGPALASALYGDAALRSSNDLDLLVRGRDLFRCETLLLDRGFLASGPPGDHDRRFIRNELLVELHFELASPRYFSFDLARIWSHSHPLAFRGQPARALSDVDLVLYLSSHGLRHEFSRLIWIMDVARALRSCPPDDYEELFRQARRQGLEPCLLIACEVVRAMFPEHMPQSLDSVMDISANAATITSSKAVAMARRAAHRLFSEHRAPAYIDYHGLYMQAEPSPFKRWRYRLKYLVPTTSDRQWARTYRMQPALTILVRPFRLVQKYGLRKAFRIAFPQG